MNIDQLARKGIMELMAYVPGRAIEEVEKEYGVKRWVKLASNENLLGPSPKVAKAIRKEVRNIHFYPEAPCSVLKKVLGRRFSLKEGNIVISNGADNLIFMVANAFVDQDDEVVMATPTFPVYTNTTQIMGGTPVRVPLKDFTHDLPEMLKRVNEKTKLVYVCNPNNPTGTIVTRKALDDFISKLPDRVILILDEAYFDFVDDRNFPNGLGYVKKGKQVIVLRTFSKVYGLAGLRIGYALGREDLIKGLNQVRDPFPVHRLAQVAAEAALKDRKYEQMSIRMIRDGRKYLYRELERLGLSYVPSQANFILIDFGRDINEVYESLLREGIIIRPGGIWNYPTSGRVTVGKLEDHRKFIKALRKILR
jgi:histidinol-phosphate aminotransferase